MVPGDKTRLEGEVLFSNSESTHGQTGGGSITLHNIVVYENPRNTADSYRREDAAKATAGTKWVKGDFRPLYSEV
jgi:hypothetical protein